MTPEKRRVEEAKRHIKDALWFSAKKQSVRGRPLREARHSLNKAVSALDAFLSQHPVGDEAGGRLEGLTVVAQTGDGPLRGRVVSVSEDGVQLQLGEAWFEAVTWECLYASDTPPEPKGQDRLLVAGECVNSLLRESGDLIDHMPDEAAKEAMRGTIRDVTRRMDEANAWPGADSCQPPEPEGRSLPDKAPGTELPSEGRSPEAERCGGCGTIPNRERPTRPGAGGAPLTKPCPGCPECQPPSEARSDQERVRCDTCGSDFATVCLRAHADLPERHLHGAGDCCPDDFHTPRCLDCGKRKDEEGVPAICAAWHTWTPAAGAGLGPTDAKGGTMNTCPSCGSDDPSDAFSMLDRGRAYDAGISGCPDPFHDPGDPAPSDTSQEKRGTLSIYEAATGKSMTADELAKRVDTGQCDCVQWCELDGPNAAAKCRAIKARSEPTPKPQEGEPMWNADIEQNAAEDIKLLRQEGEPRRWTIWPEELGTQIGLVASGPEVPGEVEVVEAASYDHLREELAEQLRHEAESVASWTTTLHELRERAERADRELEDARCFENMASEEADIRQREYVECEDRADTAESETASLLTQASEWIGELIEERDKWRAAFEEWAPRIERLHDETATERDQARSQAQRHRAERDAFLWSTYRAWGHLPDAQRVEELFEKRPDLLEVARDLDANHPADPLQRLPTNPSPSGSEEGEGA